MAISRFSTSSVAQGLPKYQEFWDNTTVLFDSDYELIERITLSSPASSVTFSSIPGTYRHLQIRSTIRNAVLTTGGQSQMRINGDSGQNYTYHTLYTGGSTVSSDGSGDVIWAYGIDRFAGANDPANTFGSSILDFLDYASTSKFKTIRSLGGYDANGSGQVRLHSALWRSTSAITSIYFENQGGGNYAAGSTLALYGIKGVA